ncbi:hypothetical protein CCACVL1_00872 [Corchorus capsularis]|uniref:Uncharacterized protein n=1 Tax=Corchorus capsularis TaxID=210143 RepID=A0A1R3KU11_COCAP|nr:hypothetical protein CCACVL1_00872 [Corchorus capsularis]
MSNSGGFTVTRTHTDNRFYNPPARRHLLKQQQLQQIQGQLQKELERPVKTDSRVNSVDSMSEVAKESDVSTLSSPSYNLTNLDRLMESVTPLVPVQYFSEV